MAAPVRECGGRATRILPALLLCAACTMPVGMPVRTEPPAPPARGDDSMAEVARGVIAAVNGARHARGFGQLAEDTALNRAAREHSAELAARRILDHRSTNPARHTMTMRIEAAGATWTRAAENLASITARASDVPRGVTRMWLESDGHRANMLAADFTHTGVGVAVDTRGVWYVTQLYTVPRPRR